MDSLRAAMVGFDMTPNFHPEFGAWGTTPVMTEIDMPLLGRCLALEQEGKKLLWFAIDLCGDNVSGTDALRLEISQAIGLKPEQIIWSTSQTHSSPTLPGSEVPGGSSVTVRGDFDADFCNAERTRFVDSCIEAGREALYKLQPAIVRFGQGYCDNVSYNTRFPMPTGGVKFSRNYGEGIQGGKYFDPTVGLVQFEDSKGNALGAILNFCCHPATMINDKYASPDYVGTAREYLETAIGAPVMFVQGFCGDIHNYYMFTTPKQARILGTRLGKAAVAATRDMESIQNDCFDFSWETVELPCRDMYTRDELQEHIDMRLAFVEELKEYPDAVWVAGVNVPEQMSVQDKAAIVQVNIEYLKEGLRMLDAGLTARTSLEISLGAIRIGDLLAVISPGENFAVAGKAIRDRSPFQHTLICGDSNGLFGYIGNDKEIDRGGYETDTYWKMLYIDGFRLSLKKGSAQRIISTALKLAQRLHSQSPE